MEIKTKLKFLNIFTNVLLSFIESFGLYGDLLILRWQVRKNTGVVTMTPVSSIVLAFAAMVLRG